MTELILLGTRGLAADLMDLLDELDSTEGGGRWECKGLLAEDAAMLGQQVAEYRVLDTIEAASRFAGVSFALAVAPPDDPRGRAAAWARAGVALDRLPRLVHPRAMPSRRARLGAGVVLLGGASIGAFANIGDGTCVTPHVRIGHDAEVGRFAVVAAGACVAPRARVGDCCFIGMNATIVNGVSVGAGSFVAAGAVVTADVAERTLVAGNPARVVRVLP